MKLAWFVKRFDCNSQRIIDHDIFKYRQDDIKKLKKKCTTKAEFAKELEYDLRWRYWCRSEHELIVELVGKRVLLKPWSGCREPMKAAIDVTEEAKFNWYDFADHHIDRQLYEKEAKIDVWDQCSWTWNTLVDYCWYTRLPYERRHEKFER